MICHIHTKFNYLNWLFFISHQLLCSRQASALSLVNKLSAKDPSLKVPDGLKAKPNPQSGIKHQWSNATMCFTSGPLLCGLMNALTETHLLLAFCLVLSSWVDQHYYFSTATKLVTIHSNTCYSIYIFFVIALLNIQIRIIISNDIDRIFRSVWLFASLVPFPENCAWYVQPGWQPLGSTWTRRTSPSWSTSRNQKAPSWRREPARI
jgi:hypothetical protein